MTVSDQKTEKLIKEIDEWTNRLRTDLLVHKEIGDLIEAKIQPDQYLKPSVVVRREKYTVYVLNSGGEIETMNADFADYDCVKL
jgi:hypothetical protein